MNNLVIAAIDEVGVGSLAGPVLSAAIITRKEFAYCKAVDSKKLSESKRELIYKDLVNELSFSIGMANNQEIDQMNIKEATFLSMSRAIDALPVKPDIIIVDGKGTRNINDIPTIWFVKGDVHFPAISAASIIAKVTRDRIMYGLSAEYNDYGWGNNKGYPTASHKKIIKQIGLSPYHRKSFSSA